MQSTQPQPMLHRFIPVTFLDPHGHEHLVAMCGTLFTTVASLWVMMANANGPNDGEVKLLLMPLIGSMISTMGAYLRAPKEEARKQASRCIYSVALGTALPVVFGFCSDYGKQMAEHPVWLFVAGFSISTVIYMLSGPVLDKGFAKSGALAEAITDVAIDAAQNAAHLPRHYSHDNKPDTDPPTPPKP